MTDERKAGPSAAAIEVLDASECHAVLAGQRLGIVAMTDGADPYAIPMFYGFDPGTGELYVGVSEGKKTQLLDANPRVSVTVTDVGPGASWKSVIVRGRAEWVEEGDRRQKAIEVLMAHNRKFSSGQPKPAPTGEVKMEQRNHAGGRMMRIAEAVMTGRTKR